MMILPSTFHSSSQFSPFCAFKMCSVETPIPCLENPNNHLLYLNFILKYDHEKQRWCQESNTKLSKKRDKKVYSPEVKYRKRLAVTCASVKVCSSICHKTRQAEEVKWSTAAVVSSVCPILDSSRVGFFRRPAHIYPSVSLGKFC